MKKQIVRIGISLLLVAVAGPRTVGAQQPPQPQGQPSKAAEPEKPTADRVYRGLFGDPQNQNGGLALVLSVSQEYTNDLATDGTGLVFVKPLAQQSGYFSGFRGDLTYHRRMPGGAIGFRSEGSMRYYRSLGAYTTLRFSSAVDVSAALDRRRRSSLRLGQSLEYTPFGLAVYQALSVPVLDQVGLGADRDDQLIDRAHYISGTTLGYSYELTPRLTMSVDSQYRFTYSGDPTFDVRQFQGKAAVSRRFSPYLALQGGYGFRRGQLPSDATIRVVDSHDIDLGLAYNRPLTRSRRTTMSVTSGSAVLDDAGRQQYRVIGSANVRHQMPKGWTLQIGYDRGLQIVEGFADPLLNDTVLATLGGFVTPRAEFSLAAGYSAGTVGFGDRPFNNTQGSARLRYALSRYLAIEGQYLFYRFDFGDGIALLSFVPRQQLRHAARVAIAVWLPMSR